MSNNSVLYFRFDDSQIQTAIDMILYHTKKMIPTDLVYLIIKYCQKVAEEERTIQVTNENGIGIRRHAEMPGLRVGGKIFYGEILQFKQKKLVHYEGYLLTFYELEDGRGWIHNFVANRPAALDGIKALSADKVKTFLNKYNLRSSAYIWRIRGDISTKDCETLAYILKQNKSVTDLTLTKNKIAEASATDIARGIRTNSYLKNIRLLGNGLANIGVIAFSNILRTNSTLMLLQINCNKIGDSGARAIAEALKSNQSLLRLNLKKNEIADVGAVAISNTLQLNSILTSMDISCNRIGQKGAVAIVNIFKKNTTLELLKLQHNKIPQLYTKALDKIDIENSHITIYCNSQDLV